MTPVLDERPAEAEDPAPARDHLVHTVCRCDENRALCGRDVTDEPWVRRYHPEEQCVVCVDIARCPDCGRQLL